MARLALSLAAAAAAVSPFVPFDRAWADESKAEIRGDLDKGLKQAIESYIGRSKRAPGSRFEARRRAQEAAQDAIVVLRAEGYYAYTVEPQIEGEPPRPAVKIETGPRFTIQAPLVSWANQPPGLSAQADAIKAIQLPDGSPGRAADVVAAEGRIVAALQKDGYADADAQPREVIVDHADRSVRPTYRIDSRTLATLDGVQVRTSGRTNPKWVASLAPWRSGELYKPEAVAELERRLLDTGVYNAVTVALAPEADAQGRRPVVVSLADRRPANVALGASWSTTEGAGVNGRLTFYNRLRRADTITVSAQYANIMKRVDLQLSLPHWRKPQRTLELGAAAYRDDTDAYEENDVGVHGDIVHRFRKTSFFTYGLSLDFSRDNEKTLVGTQIVGVQRDLFLATGLARLSLDRSDDPLNPTTGWRFDGRVEPTFGTGADTLLYAKVQAQVSGYLPLSKAAATVIAGRIHLGSILSTRDTVDLPASRRFYAGGGGSIRGFGYQAVGPRFPDDTPIGGQSLAEGSLELRQHIAGRFGAVLFADAGTVSAEKYPDFKDFSIGAGVGLRYDLGFAPIRVDFAVPLNRRPGDGPFQIYLSLGQSF